MFLKRHKVEDVRLRDLFVGASVNILARQFHITGFADEFTRRKLGSKQEKTFAMIKPDAISQLGNIIAAIESSDLTVAAVKMTRFARTDAERKCRHQCSMSDRQETHNLLEFYAEHRGKPFYDNLVSFMTSGPVLGLELIGQDAIAQWRALLGPTNVAKQEAPSSIRGRFGSDNTRNACHGSDSPASAARELDFFFGPKSKLPSTALGRDSTLAIIKPHAVVAKQVGAIISSIVASGFSITAAQSFTLSTQNAEEFLEVYKGVVAEFPDMLAEFTAGTCLALEVFLPGGAQQSFRDLVGPADPEIARHIRSNSLRAKFGASKTKNAVHCTDLPDDAQLEVDFFFKILQ